MPPPLDFLPLTQLHYSKMLAVIQVGAAPIKTQKKQFVDILLKFVPQMSNWIGGTVMLFNGIITPCFTVSAVSWVALNYGHRPTAFNICVFMCHTVGFCLMPMSYNVVLQCTRNVIVQTYDVAMLLCTRMSSNKARFGSCQQLFIIPRTTQHWSGWLTTLGTRLPIMVRDENLRFWQTLCTWYGCQFIGRGTRFT